MSIYDGVAFGSDQVGSYAGNPVGPYYSIRQHLYPNAKYPGHGLEFKQDYFPSGVTQFARSPGIYMPDGSTRPWTQPVDQLALTTKLQEGQMRDAYQKREFFDPMKHGGCQCANCNQPPISINVLCYIFLFIIIILLAVYHMIGSQIENLKELLRLSKRE